MINTIKIALCIFILFSTKNYLGANSNSVHPNLLISKADVPLIKSNLDKYPLFYKSFLSTKESTDKAIANGIIVPIPKDAGGGYTHEQHKLNYKTMFNAGILYQYTSDVNYFNFIREMLLKYANLYPKLGLHPEGKKQTPGKLFWQSLNETVWLLHTIQAYDCIYNDLDVKERTYIEENLFIPMAEFFINDCRHELDLIHNHGTWIVAAVGMTGFVLGNESYVKKALYGYNEKGESGFLAQMRKLFSPDGFYSEGPYYARYALWPFFVFAESINNNLPELEIYKYRDGILGKAINSLLQLTYTNGEFIPINDAIKEKNWLTPELIYGLTYTFKNYGQDPHLLSIVKKHQNVTLDGAGFYLAKELESMSEIPDFNWKSITFTDGADGNEGGLTILRNGSRDNQLAAVFKYGGHGLSHGHFDKLNLIVYDNGSELLPDYGAARFLNIEQKYGGRYLPENNSFAKQTIAHNTLVIDKQSQYNGNRQRSQKHHSELFADSLSNRSFQYVSAIENNAYNANMHRTIIMYSDSNFRKPIIIDVLDVKSKDQHVYDIPYYYQGQLIGVNFDFKAFQDVKNIMGNQNGYQHLWKDAVGKNTGLTQLTWLNNTRFYTISTLTDSSTKIYHVSTGGTDPNFNLRNQKGFLFRNNGTSKTFVTIIEPHGEFNPKIERTINSYSNIKGLELINLSKEIIVLNIKYKDSNYLLFIDKFNSKKDVKNSFNFKGKTINWFGPISVKKL